MQTPPSSHRRRVESLGGTLPRASSGSAPAAGSLGGEPQRRAVAFGKQSAGRRRLWGRVTGKFSRSEPNLGDGGGQCAARCLL